MAYAKATRNGAWPRGTEPGRTLVFVAIKARQSPLTVALGIPEHSTPYQLASVDVGAASDDVARGACPWYALRHSPSHILGGCDRTAPSFRIVTPSQPVGSNSNGGVGVGNQFRHESAARI